MRCKLYLSSWRFLPESIGYAVRRLCKVPRFSATIIAMVTVSVALTMVSFSIVDIVLLRPLPFPDSGKLLMPWEFHAVNGNEEVSYPDFEDWRSRNRVFDGLASYTYRSYSSFVLSVSGVAEEVEGTFASHDLFSVVGITPTLGRTFAGEEETSGHDHVVLLSDSLWRRRFHEDPNVLGLSVTINDELYTIIGVLPDRLSIPQWASLWLPLSLLPKDLRSSRSDHILEVIGRRRKTITSEQVNAEMRVIVAQLQKEYPITNAPTGFVLTTLVDHTVGNLRPILWLLGISAGLLMLMTCSNVSNLLLTRLISLQPEMSVRSALGADQARLLILRCGESLVLSVPGVVLGTSCAAAILSALRKSSLGLILPRCNDLQFSMAVAGLTGVLCIAAVVFFAIAQTVRIVRSNSSFRVWTNGGSRATATSRQRRAQQVLLGLESALALMVLVETGLLAHSFRQALSINLGFRTSHILTMHLALPPVKYRQRSSNAYTFFQHLLPRLEQLPGVQAVATVNTAPFSGHVIRFAIADKVMPSQGHFPIAQSRIVSPDYFRLLDLPESQGRHFDQQDCDAGYFVVNEAMSAKYFDHTNPVGRALLLGLFEPSAKRFPVIGMVSDVRDVGVEQDPQPTIYRCGYVLSSTLLVKTEVDPLAMTGLIQKEILAIDRDLGIGEIATMDRIVSNELLQRKIGTLVFGFFAVFAVLIALSGVSSVFSYSVMQRERELAVRAALGARRVDFARLLALEAAKTVVPALAVGLVLASALSHTISSLLFQVAPMDQIVFILSPCVIGLLVILVLYGPLQRASSIDPACALRSE